MRLYPLRFTPIFRRYIWGGRRLQTILGKPIGAGDDYAESWEAVDHGKDQSVVSNGPLSGASLREIVVDHGSELFGVHYPQDQFPLLLKFLDANRILSVQVHPDDAQAALQDPPDLGKTEAWVILSADPESKIFAGLSPGVTRETLAAAIESEATESCLHAIEPREGDCIFIPAGTVHALGAGLVVAEIQQASDTTFRLFDWNRVDANGQPRPLHVEQALDVIDYDTGPVQPQHVANSTPNTAAELVRCDKFVLNRWHIDRTGSTISGNGRFHLCTVIRGSVNARCDSHRESLSLGDTMLVPASCGDIEISAENQAVLLEIHLP